jgi:hypothetical protein
VVTDLETLLMTSHVVSAYDSNCHALTEMFFTDPYYFA